MSSSQEDLNAILAEHELDDTAVDGTALAGLDVNAILAEDDADELVRFPSSS